MKKQKTLILIIHLILAFFSAYMSFMLINKKRLSPDLGWIFMFLSMFLLIFHVYLYSKGVNESYNQEYRGIHIDKNDPKYKKYIGGLPDMGWV